MIQPPDKNLSDKKFTLWIILILIIMTFQFVLTLTGHRQLDAGITGITVAENARACPTPQTAELYLSP